MAYSGAPAPSKIGRCSENHKGFGRWAIGGCHRGIAGWPFEQYACPAAIRSASVLGKKGTFVDEYIGTRLKAFRKTRGMSQSVLAKAATVTFQQVQKYENGTNRISVGRLYDFARILEIDVRTFFDDLKIATDHAQNPGITLTHEDFELASRIAKIQDPKIRKKLIDLVKALADG